MEKLFFIFRRKPDATRADFYDHYVTTHAPLGLRHKKGLSGYTVNLLDSEADFDAATEIWTPSIADFTGGTMTSDGDRAITADHIGFMGPQDGYAVEERIVRDGPLPPAAPGVPAPGAKFLSFHAVGEALPAPYADATRVVDNVVRTIIYRRDRRLARTPGEPGDVAVIRTTWLADDRDGPAGALRVREYRNRAVA